MHSSIFDTSALARTHTYTNTNANVHTRTHTHTTRAHTHTQTHTQVYTHTHTHTHTHTQRTSCEIFDIDCRADSSTSMKVCVYLCMYGCVCVRVCDPDPANAPEALRGWSSAQARMRSTCQVNMFLAFMYCTYHAHTHAYMQIYMSEHTFSCASVESWWTSLTDTGVALCDRAFIAITSFFNMEEASASCFLSFST